MTEVETYSVNADSKLHWTEGGYAALSLPKIDPEFLITFASATGRTLMTIKPDGTVNVDGLQPATETAKQVLDLLVKWMPYYMRNNNPLEGELIEDEGSPV